MKLLWTSDRPTFDGKYYRLDEAPYRIETLQRPHPPILVGGGDERMLQIVAEHADLCSPMIRVTEAKAKVGAYCHEAGRDPSTIRWFGGGSLFLHDDPSVVASVIAWAAQQYNQTEAEVRAGGIFGNVEDARETVRRQIADGCEEIIVFQLPRVHTKSLMRFSDEVIPAFR